MSQQVDVLVVGAGPGGYVAAIRAAQLGFTTACAEMWADAVGSQRLGGTCLNVGCIPSKALLQSSENYLQAGHHFADHGVMIEKVEIDVARMMARKQKIVDEGSQGVQFLFRKNKITSLFGKARFVGRSDQGYELVVERHGEQHTITAKNVIIATGSRPRTFPSVVTDNVRILDNEGALSLTEVPKRLGVIGAGVIGLEMGSVWKRLGSQVTVLEAAPTFLGAADDAVAKEALKQFTKQGLAIHLGVKIEEIKDTGKLVKVKAVVDGQAQTLEFDKLIVSIGRVPYTEGLGLDSVGVAVDERGFVKVDHACATNVPGIYAIGDVVQGPMLAHKASEEGVFVAEVLAGQKPHLDHACIPWVIYTDPEIAWVGQTEHALKQAGIEYRVGQSIFAPNGRAKGLGNTVGFVKMLACAKTDEILGVHIVGPYASELIGECVVAMSFKAASEDIARIIHAHPSLAEVIHEAALALDKRPIHA